MKKENIATIYNLYVDDLHTYGLYLGFEKEIVMDAIHDVFCKLAVDKSLLDTPHIKFFLFKSLKNRLIDIYKTQRRHTNLSEIDTNRAMPFDIKVTIEDIIQDREERKQVKNQIEEMMNSLTDRQREIIYLRYIQECDYPQIAELLEISVNACYKLVSKALQSLRDKFGTLAILLLLS